jgi:macrolide transport system ATP-binding/permease protein
MSSGFAERERLRAFAARVRALFGRRQIDQDFAQELDAHVSLLIEENIRHGMTPEEAGRAARMRLGGVTQLREIHRELQGLPWLETLAQDIRYALRMLRRNPGFTAVAVLTLGLGIGATTAIFSAVDALVLKPLPFSAADRLVQVESLIAATGHGGVASYPDLLDWRARNHVFEGMAAYRTGDFNLLLICCRACSSGCAPRIR